MTAICVLHVDDEADIREIVERSLCLDPVFTVHSCGSGKEAFSAAAEWQPDVILLDAVMPGVDGPASFLQLQQDARTACIPVVFMTVRAQAREVDRFRTLGGVGVIAKTFDPMTLAATVRRYVNPSRDPFDDLRTTFLQRVKRDSSVLARDRTAMEQGCRSPDALGRIRHLAHGLSGAGGIYGFADISDAAATLEDAVIAEIEDGGSSGSTDHALDCLIAAAEENADVETRPGRASMPA